MADDSGLKGGLSASQPILMLIAGFTAIAWYNVIELNIMVYFRFKRHRGLYFWSLCISSWGIALHALGILVKFFQVWKNDFVSVACICLGWYCMVTGQSLVLYSRLHLVVRKRGGVRWVLVMIVVNAVVLHSITTVLVFGANSSYSDKFVYPYSVMEKIQVTIFAIQETTISSLYVYHTYRLLHPQSLFPQSSTRKVMRHLLRVNILIIVMDLTLLGTEFANHYEIQTTYKSALYSIKLKLEFVVLNQLVKLTKDNLNAGRRRRNERRDSVDSGPRGAGGLADERRGRVDMNRWPRKGSEWVSNGAQGIEPPTQTYFVSASTSSPSSRIRSFCGDNDVGVLKTVDVEVTVEKERGERKIEIGECEARTGAPMLKESDIEFITGNTFLEDIIEVPTPTSPCQGKERIYDFP